MGNDAEKNQKGGKPEFGKEGLEENHVLFVTGFIITTNIRAHLKSLNLNLFFRNYSATAYKLSGLGSLLAQGASAPQL
jgi:hypothetical protein